MATINLQWVPANNANATGQRLTRIAKVNGANPILKTDFNPDATNDIGKAVGSATFTTTNTNLIYRFMVETICTGGTTTPNNTGVREGIKFECVPFSVKQGDVTLTTYTARVLKNYYSTVDGVAHSPKVSSITAVEFSLYDAANTTPVAGAILGTLVGTGDDQAFEYTFPNLAPDTQYTLRHVLLSVLNGTTTVRSDTADQLNGPCFDSVGTLGTACREYDIQNISTTQTHSIIYKDCNSTNQPPTPLSPTERLYLCALKNSVLADNLAVSVLDFGECRPCIGFQNRTISAITGDYTACNGILMQGQVQEPDAIICGKTGIAGSSPIGSCTA